MADKKTNRVPLGEILGKAESDAITLSFRLDVKGMTMEADEAKALEAARTMLRRMLTKAAESTGRAIQAILLAHAKGDGSGANALHAHFGRAHAALSIITGEAIQNVAKAGVCFPKLDVAHVVPPGEGGVPMTYERIEGKDARPPGPRLVTDV